MAEMSTPMLRAPRESKDQEVLFGQNPEKDATRKNNNLDLKGCNRCGNEKEIDYKVKRGSI